MHLFRRKILPFILIAFHYTTAIAQGPNIWIFGRNAGLDFNSGQALPIIKETDNIYSSVAVQCDEAGKLLFYCDGRTIKDKDGAAMTGYSNAVWPSPNISMELRSNIVPIPQDTNRYYVFTISPSSGVPPFGTYYSGVLTYSIVDMRLNNGNGDVDPNYSNILLSTDISRYMLVVPARICNNYWLIVGKSSNYGVTPARFYAYNISENGIAIPVQSAIDIDSMDKYETFREFDMQYAYKYRKIIENYQAHRIVVHDFDNETGILSNGQTVLGLQEFISPGGGVTEPRICLSPKEKYLYLFAPINGITVRQYPINLESTNVGIGTPTVVFQTDSSYYKIPSPGISVPYFWSGCDIRRGPDGKIYLFFSTAQSFVGQIMTPDNEGTGCNVMPLGIQLLPNTFGSYFFPAIDNKRSKPKIEYRTHDTLLCFVQPFLIRPSIEQGNKYYYEWNNRSTDAAFEVSTEGKYWVRSSADCNDPQYVDTFNIKFETAEKCNCSIFLPNAFSPNNDQINDVFKPIIPITCIKRGYFLKVFNRWGQLIFSTTDILASWDGKMNAKACDIGNYYYFISYIDFLGETKNKKGHFLLLR